jgi:hypothetical protein
MVGSPLFQKNQKFNPIFICLSVNLDETTSFSLLCDAVSVFIFRFCGVAQVVIIRKYILARFEHLQNMKGENLKHLLIS